MFILGLTLFTCFFVGNLYCQDSTKYVIELEKINVDHPAKFSHLRYCLLM